MPAGIHEHEGQLQLACGNYHQHLRTVSSTAWFSRNCTKALLEAVEVKEIYESKGEGRGTREITRELDTCRIRALLLWTELFLRHLPSDFSPVYQTPG